MKASVDGWSPATGLGLSASLAVADMEGPRVPPKGTEGPTSASPWSRRAWRSGCPARALAAVPNGNGMGAR